MISAHCPVLQINIRDLAAGFISQHKIYFGCQVVTQGAHIHLSHNNGTQDLTNASEAPVSTNLFSVC